MAASSVRSVAWPSQPPGGYSRASIYPYWHAALRPHRRSSVQDVLNSLLFGDGGLAGCWKFCCRKDCRLGVLWYVKFHLSIHHLQFITNQGRTLSVQKRQEYVLDRSPAIMSFFYATDLIFIPMFLSLPASLNDPQMLLRSVFSCFLCQSVSGHWQQ